MTVQDCSTKYFNYQHVYLITVTLLTGTSNVIRLLHAYHSVVCQLQHLVRGDIALL